MEDRQLLRIEAAAALLSVSHWTLRSWLKQGRLQAVPVGKLRLIPRTEVDRIAREGMRAGLPVAA